MGQTWEMRPLDSCAIKPVVFWYQATPHQLRKGRLMRNYIRNTIDTLGMIGYGFVVLTVGIFAAIEEEVGL